MKGRKRKPEALKKLDGNPGKRPIKNVVALSPGRPVMPRGLNARQKRLWNQLCEMLDSSGLLQRLDHVSLELFVRTYDEFLTLDAYIRRHGRNYKSKTAHGFIYRRRPETADHQVARRAIITMLSEFGFTPTSRTRLEAADPAAAASEGDGFLEGVWDRKQA